MGHARRNVSEATDELVLALRCADEAGIIDVRPTPGRAHSVISWPRAEDNQELQLAKSLVEQDDHNLDAAIWSNCELTINRASSLDVSSALRAPAPA